MHASMRLPPTACCVRRRIAYLVWKGRRGYSWDDMPDVMPMSLS